VTQQALISVGTNSTRVLVAEVEPEIRIVLQRSVGTRIGEGLKDSGHIQEAALQRTLEAIREHVEAARAYTGELRVIATSAVRRAGNRSAFDQAVREMTGVLPTTISGEEEACCSFAGATAQAPGSAPGLHLGVADAGGGSTEYAAGVPGRCDRTVSCEIGAVRLTEAVPDLAGGRAPVSRASLEKARSAARAALRPLDAFPPVDRLFLVGGSATTAVSLLRGDREAFEYADLSRNELAALVERLRWSDLPARKALPGINPQRADILLAGFLILDCLFETVHRETACIAAHDVLLGYLLRHPLA
jgi:exopolyphosphatase/guanosine-5'-triphosphate,3'-diphosphate pyrophosphatase